MVTNVPRPSAASEDSSVALITSAGATSDRSTTIRMRNTTSRMSGAIRVRSRTLPSEVSTASATEPPTSASAPGTASTASRSATTLSSERSVAGAASRVTVTWDHPVPDSPAETAVTTPSTDWAASRTADSVPVRARTMTGSVTPAGKCSAAVSRPAADSDGVRNCSVWLSPMRVPNRPKHRTTSRSTQATRTRTGCSTTREAIRPQTPGGTGSSNPSGVVACRASPVLSCRPPAEPGRPSGRGMNGQNSPRPHTARAAGRATRA